MWTFLPSRPVAALLIAAFVLRAGMAFVVQGLLDHRWHRQFVIEGDAGGYWRLGQAIAAGEPYAVYEPPRYVLRMPGFPLLLSVPISLSGGNFLAARLFLAGVGTIACGLVYLLGRDLANERVGLLAGWFTAVSPAMAGFSVMILSETPFAVGVTGSVWAMARLLRAFRENESLSMKIFWSLAAGGFVALATYVRPTWLPLALVFPVWLCISGRLHRDSVFAGAVLAGAVFVSLLPWAMRNHRVTGHWVFTTLWSGPSLYDGLNPEATGQSDMTFFERDNLPAKMSEYEINAYYWNKAVEYAKSHPGRAVELAFLKLWRFWKPWPSAEEAGGWAAKAVIAAFAIVLYAGCLAGLWIYRRQFTLLALTLGPVLLFSVIHAVFVGSIRYRLPAEYPMSVLAAAGCCAIAGRFARPRSSETLP